MSNEFKTFEGVTSISSFTDDSSSTDGLRNLKREGVSRMRTSLLSCSVENPASTKQAINQITVLRIYHQIARIIRYLDLMDKLEDKLYDSIEHTIDNADVANPSTWMMLIKLQERMQQLMIDSHKMLQPYLQLEDFSITELMPQASDDETTNTQIMSAESREKIRNSAQAVMIALNAG